MIKMTFACLSVITIFFASAVLADTEALEIISLKNRQASDLIPILTPHVSKDGSISGMGDKLIIKTNPENLAQIKAILAEIDKVPRRLLISVRQNMTQEQLGKDVSVSAKVKVGEDGRVATGPKEPVQGASVVYRDHVTRFAGRVASEKASKNSDETRKIQVLEGTQAFISTGTSIPYTERTYVRDRNGLSVSRRTSYQDSSSGVYVLPRISGDRVILEISSQKSAPADRGRINSQSASTIVSVRFGEWVEIGGVARSGSASRAGITGISGSSGKELRGIFVRLTEVE